MLLIPKREIIRPSRRALITGALATTIFSVLGSDSALANFSAVIDSGNFQGNGTVAPGSGVTLNTTGATLFIMTYGGYNGGGAFAPADSQSLSWNNLTAFDNVFGRSQISWATGTGTSGHQFGATGGFFTACILAISGNHASPFDVEATTMGSGGSTQDAGPLTPTYDGSFCVATMCPPQPGSGSMTCDSGFSVIQQQPAGANLGCAMAVLQQGAGGGGVTIDPTFTGYANTGSCAASAAFRPASFTPPGGNTNKLMMRPIP